MIVNWSALLVVSICGVLTVPSNGYLLEGWVTRGTTNKQPLARSIGNAIAVAILLFAALYDGGRYAAQIVGGLFVFQIFALFAMVFFVKHHDAQEASFQNKGIVIYLTIVTVIALLAILNG